MFYWIAWALCIAIRLNVASHMLYVWSEHHTEINLKQMFSYYSIPFCHSHILRFVILLIFPLSVQPLKPHFQNIFIYDLFHIASNCIAHYTTYLMHIECVSYSYTNLCIPNIVQQKKNRRIECNSQYWVLLTLAPVRLQLHIRCKMVFQLHLPFLLLEKVFHRSVAVLLFSVVIEL